MALDDDAARILRQNLPEECLDAGVPLVSALVAKPEATARAMDLMEMKIEALQQELVRLVKGSGAGPAVSGARALVVQAARLRGGVKTIDTRLGEIHGAVGPALELPLTAVGSSASERAELLQQVQTHDKLASTMAALSLLRNTITQYDADVAVGDLVAAARGVCALEDMLGDEPLASLVVDDARPIVALASMIASKRAELSDMASAAVRHSFVVGRRGSGSEMVVRCRFRSVLPMASRVSTDGQSSNEVVSLRLPMVWTCLKTLGGDLVTASVRVVADALHSHFIDPLFSKPVTVQEGGEECEAPTLEWELQVDDVVQADGSLETSSAATLRVHSVDSARKNTAGFAKERLLDPLARLVEALHAITCGGNSDLCCAFGSEIWPRLTEQLAESGCLHAQDAEAVGMFETRLRKVGFVVELDKPNVDASSATTSTASVPTPDAQRVAVSTAESTAAASSLADHVEGLRHREAKEACAQLLSRARQALVSINSGQESLESCTLNQSEAAGGIPSSFAQTVMFDFPVCETSSAAQSIVALLRECVQLVASRYADEPGTS